MTSAPPTSWQDCILLVAFTVPLALICHALIAASMFQSAKRSDNFTETSYRKLFWGLPSLLLTWAPLLAAVLGYIGCSLWRDAGHLIFPWPLFSVAILSGLTGYVCQWLRQSMVRKHFPPAPVHQSTG